VSLKLFSILSYHLHLQLTYGFFFFKHANNNATCYDIQFSFSVQTENIWWTVQAMELLRHLVSTNLCSFTSQFVASLFLSGTYMGQIACLLFPLLDERAILAGKNKDVEERNVTI
jgi:hypothetical protein